jgi:MFS family permease
MSGTTNADAVSEPSAALSAGLLAPLRQRSFAWYFTGQFLSQIGDGIYLVALPFIVLGAGLGSEGLGTILACFGAARLLAYPLGGTLADRLGSVRAMLGTDLLRTLLVFGFGAVVLSTRLTLATAIPIVVVLGVLEGIFMPASFAVLPQIVPAENLAAGNSLVSTMQSTAMITGPGIGGPLMAGFRGGLSLLIDAGTFLVSTVTLFAVRRSVRPPRRDPAHEAGDGAEAAAEGGQTWRSVLSYVAGSPLIKMSLLVTLVLNLTYAGMTEVALPSFSQTTLHRGAAGFSIIMVGFGIGSLVGGLSGMVLMRMPHRAIVALVLGIGQGAAIMCIPLHRSLAVATGAMVVAGALQVGLNVFYLTILQTRIPASGLARVMSLLIACAGVAFPAATSLAGIAVRHVGAGSVIVVAGAFISIAFGIGFVSREYRTL